MESQIEGNNITVVAIYSLDEDLGRTYRQNSKERLSNFIIQHTLGNFCVAEVN